MFNQCDGVRPRCSNCAKRGVNSCQYDAEGTQSNKIAIYKAKIDSQKMHIAALEEEVLQLRDLAQRATSSTPSLPTPFKSMSIASTYPQLPAVTASPRPTLHPSSSSSSSVRSSGITLKPMWDSLDDSRRFESCRQQTHSQHQEQNEHAAATAAAMVRSEGSFHSHSSTRSRSYDDELQNYQTQKRTLQYENIRLKELMVFLTLLDDRMLAERMAMRIRDNGLTDDLLSEANALYAAGRTKPTQSHAEQGLVKMPKLPALSSLDLPKLNSQYTPEIEALSRSQPHSAPITLPQPVNTSGRVPPGGW